MTAWEFPVNVWATDEDVEFNAAMKARIDDGLKTIGVGMTPEQHGREELARDLQKIEASITTFNHNIGYHREVADALIRRGYTKSS